MYQTSEEATILIRNGEDVIGMVAKVGRKNIIFKCEEMSYEEIAALIGEKAK